MSRIIGGYILQPRIIDESDIMSCPPCTRETWFYLLREANHNDVKYRGNIVKRGQLFRNYQEIRDALSWKIGYRTERYSEDQMKKAMKHLRDTQRITTAKALGGVLITICNYDYYQDVKNYEGTSENTSRSTNNAPITHQCTPHNNKNEKNENNDKNERINNNDKSLYVEFVNSFNQIKGSKYKPTKKIETQFNARIKESFTVEQMLTALRCAMKSKYHIDTGYRYLTPEFFTRSDKIEMYLNASINNQEPTKNMLEILN